MTSGTVPTAVKTYVTEYTAQEMNKIVDTIPGVFTETLKLAERTDSFGIDTKFQAVSGKKVEKHSKHGMSCI